MNTMHITDKTLYTWSESSEACPICGQALITNGKRYICPSGHYNNPIRERVHDKQRMGKRREDK